MERIFSDGKTYDVKTSKPSKTISILCNSNFSRVRKCSKNSCTKNRFAEGDKIYIAELYELGDGNE